jgi:RNA polymerase sigma factor (sigma-70 family)
MQTQPTRSSTAKVIAFAETHWSLILRAKDANPALAADALEHLCRAYWYPLYCFVRRQGNSPALAEDLTQEFFLRFTERNALAHVGREKGKFRSFLLASLKNLLSNERARASAEKRGGRLKLVSLDAADFEDRFLAEPFHEATPEKAFDRSWATTVLGNALAQLREEYSRSDKADWFAALEPHLSGERDSAPYVEIAARLNSTEAAVKMAVVRMRRRFGQLLRAHVGQTVASEAELDEELRYLFTALQ